MVIIIALIFAISVPIIFLIYVRNLNGYLKKSVVNIEQDINLTKGGLSRKEKSLSKRINIWLDDLRNSYPLYSRNLLTVFFGICAYMVATQINPFFIESGWLTRTQVIRIAGPFVEEILKAIILVILVRREDFSIATGAIYGFGAGIGFAVVENIEYILPREEIALVVAVARVFSTNLVHAAGSGLIGTAVAYIKFYRSKSDYLLASGAILFGILLHMGFNTIVSEGTSFFIALVVGLLGGLTIALIINRANKRLGSYASDVININTARASHNEAFLVKSEDDLKKVFQEVEAEFSTNHALLVDDFLKTQAEIITKQKILEVSSNEKEISRLKNDLEALVVHTNKVRNKLGWECMLFVRTRYTLDEKMWANINDRVAKSSTGQKGGGLWDRAASRVQSSKSEGDEL